MDCTTKPRVHILYTSWVVQQLRQYFRKYTGENRSLFSATLHFFPVLGSLCILLHFNLLLCQLLLLSWLLDPLAPPMDNQCVNIIFGYTTTTYLGSGDGESLGSELSEMDTLFLFFILRAYLNEQLVDNILKNGLTLSWGFLEPSSWLALVSLTPQVGS